MLMSDGFSIRVYLGLVEGKNITQGPPDQLRYVDAINIIHEMMHFLRKIAPVVMVVLIENNTAHQDIGNRATLLLKRS